MWFVTRQEVVITQKKKAAASALFLSSFFWCAVRCERVALYFVHWTAPQHGGFYDGNATYSLTGDTLPLLSFCPSSGPSTRGETRSSKYEETASRVGDGSPSPRPVGYEGAREV